MGTPFGRRLLLRAEISEGGGAGEQIRLDYLAELLAKAGMPARHVQARAAFIYRANLERNMMTRVPRRLGRKEIGKIPALKQS